MNDSQQPAGTNRSILGSEADREFLNCWARLEQLNEADWQRFYTLLRQLLGRYSFPELGATGANLTLDEAVQEFLLHKVYFKYCYQTAEKPALDHPGAIVPWFRNMLVDRIRRRTSKEEQGLYGTSLNEPLTGKEGDAAGERGDLVADAAATDPAEAVADGEIADRAEALRDGARRLLRDQGPWVAGFLAYNACAEGEAQIPLVRLKASYGMGSSYHYQAKKLGITGPKRSAWNGFGDTLIGRWLKAAGIEPEAANRATMEAALKILCEEAFREVEDHEPPENQP
jgi:hypothetical protein